MEPLKVPIAKVKEKFSCFCFLLILFLHSIFNIEKKCVLTILKAINYKTFNAESLVPRDMREGRVSYLSVNSKRYPTRGHLTKIFARGQGIRAKDQLKSSSKVLLPKL